MSVSKFSLSRRYHVLLTVVLVVLTVLFPRTGKFKYEFRKGNPWNYETLTARFDFPILKTAEEITEQRAKAAENAIPFFDFSEEVSMKVISGVASATSSLDGNLSAALSSAVSQLYTGGVVADDAFPSSEVIYIGKKKQVLKHLSSDINTVSAALETLRGVISSTSSLNADSVLIAEGVNELIVPNLEFDENSTMMMGKEVEISPTKGYLEAGQVIVLKGETVTAEIFQRLESYKAEYEASMGYGGPRILIWAGNLLVALLIIFLLVLSLLYTDRRIFDEFNKVLYVCFIQIIASAAVVLVDKINPELLYVLPLSLVAMLLLAFCRKNIVYQLVFVVNIPYLVYAHSGFELYAINVLAGAITVFTFKDFSRGWSQFVNAFFVTVAVCALHAGYCFVNDINILQAPLVFVYLASGALLSVVGYSLVPLFERMFNIVSGFRLSELCDTGKPLLRELANKAPGTFQHSLQVMNMADFVAHSIPDVDHLLLRTGALYHDIGKIMNPLCFVENGSMDVQYHAELSYKESAKDIIKHVDDGLSLADKYGLPQVIKDFIASHHGKSCAEYFLNRYLNEGGDPSDTADFYYNGKVPVSKEQIILMICDSVEAASRSLKSTTKEAFTELVTGITKTKFKAGQFSESEISIREINIIEEQLVSYLGQLFHSRIAYPTRR